MEGLPAGLLAGGPAGLQRLEEGVAEKRVVDGASRSQAAASILRCA